MNRLFAFVSLIALAGCGGGNGNRPDGGSGPDAGPQGPPQLWLALNGDELHVKLQTIEPPPY